MSETIQVSKEVKYPSDFKILSTTDLKSHITYLNDDFMQVGGFSS